MRIGELAEHAGVNVQTLRYYERRGLLAAPSRSRAGFRHYEQESLQRIRFIRRAQDLGFTLEEIRDLLNLWHQSTTACGAVEMRATTTLARIDQKIADLHRMRAALAQYTAACRMHRSVDGCPLLTSLGGESETTDDQ